MPRVSMTAGVRGRDWPARLLLLLLALLALPQPGRAQLPEAVRFTTADGLPSNAVHAAVQDRHGYLWFATEDGLARFDGRHFRVWQREQGLVGTVLTRLVLDEQDRLWMGTAQGAVMRMSADRMHIEDVIGARGAAISALLPDAAGGLWFGVRGAGVFHLQASRHLRHYLPTARGDGVPAGDVEHLVHAADGGVWVGTGRGLALWRDGRFHRPSAAYLGTTAITGMSRDAAGTVWISASQGLWRSVGGSTVQAVAAPVHARLLGIGGEDAQWLADADRVWRQPADHTAAVTVRLATVGQGAPPHVRRVLEDRNGGVWLLGRHLGVWRLPPLWQAFRAQPLLSPQAGVDGWLPGAGSAAVELQCGGQHQWKLHGHTLEHRHGGGRWQRVAWPRRVNPVGWGPLSVQCTAEGGVWVGGTAGLLHANDRQLAAVAGAPRGIRALQATADGGLWIATEGVIQRYDGHARALQAGMRVTPRDGLPAGQVNGLAVDAEGVLWATSSSGLLRIVPATRQVRVYSRDDGIPEAVLQAGLEAQGTQMLAISQDGGVLAFAPATLARPATPAPLVIERVQLRRNGQRISLPTLGPVHLRADDRDIQISARVLSAQLDPRQQYRFRLGAEARWMHTRSRGTIGFPRLPAGTHALQYQERGSDGRWSAMQTLPLQVQRSAWQHPGALAARGLALALLAAAVGALVRHGLARARRRRASLQRRCWAEQSAQAKARYLATFGHELRTPLTGVLGMGELLLAGPLAPAQQRRLAHIQEAARELLGIVDTALDEARIEAGRVPLRRERIDLPALLQQWRQQAGATLPPSHAGLALRLHLPGQPWVRADPQRLRQLLQAALAAVTQAVPMRAVRVHAHWLPGRAGLLLEMLAGPGGVARMSERRSAAALARAQACARAQQGRLQMHAQPGGGRRLVLSLPLAAAEGCPADLPESAPGAPRPPACPARVLLVEDDALVAEAHAGLLGARGASVVIAAHALAALAALAAEPFEVVLLDLDLPGLDGWQLLSLLHAQGCAVPVVVLTARTEADLAARVAAAGAVGLLHKPAGGEALAAAVQAARRG
ncbi:two-component regulator propeller domain-containing protein [Stenotrophomonas sp.]|uniref:two-component regulator propeller domain-containing protein n=1 Tax=Stenotrophomonas sp. TaxID=69392 RepID=UPI002FC8026D